MAAGKSAHRLRRARLLIGTVTALITAVVALMSALHTVCPPAASGPGAIGERHERTNISLEPSTFDRKANEFFLDVRHGIYGVPAQDGLDLRHYRVELTFSGGDGRSVNVFLKNQNWATRASAPFRIRSHTPIRYDARRDPTSFSQFGDEDLRQIYAIGGTVLEGIDGVTITSARLIRAGDTNYCSLAARAGLVAIVVVVLLAPAVWLTRRLRRRG